MGASTENFCLRWNDFESNVSGSFRELREDSDFFDVTLATSDSGNRTLQAHKVILSACSNFFKQMLRQQTRMHSHPNPLIYLRGVTYSDLLAVLDFMYHGEVNVAQDDLNSFLAVAEELQIKGLTNKEQPEATPSSSNKARPPPVRMKDTGPPPKRVRKSSPGLPVRSSQIAGTSIASGGASVIDDDDEIKEVNVKIDPEVSVLADAEEAVNPDEEGFDESYGDYYGDDGSGGMEGDGTEEDPVAGGTSDGAKDGGVMQFLKSVSSPGTPKMYHCLLCGKTSEHGTTMRRHMVCVHTEPTNEVCPRGCGRVFKNTVTLDTHLRTQICLKGKSKRYQSQQKNEANFAETFEMSFSDNP